MTSLPVDADHNRCSVRAFAHTADDCSAPPVPVDWETAELKTCDAFVYDHSVYSATVVTDFHLVCERCENHIF